MRPLALRSAGRSRSDTALVRHVGRRSGRSYQTPVMAVAHGDDLLIALPYGEGPTSCNVLASGTVSLVVDGRTYDLDR